MIFNNIYVRLGAEISKTSKYFDRFIELDIIEGVRNDLFEHIDCVRKERINSLNDISREDPHTMLLLNGTFGHHEDIQSLLTDLHDISQRHWRIVLLCYNSYLKWLYSLASFLRLRTQKHPTNFQTYKTIENFCRLCNFEIVGVSNKIHFPFYWFGLGILFDKIISLIPLINRFNLGTLFFLRPVIAEKNNPSLSIIIPARNEAENLKSILSQFTKLEEIDKEFIIVEGHSEDNTWEVMESLAKRGEEVKIYRQEGEGKYDAVKLGFSKSTKDLLVILDGDKTVPPEELYKFYYAYCQGKGDFINGSRLVYAMETGAMPFLNLLANQFFAKALCRLLNLPLTDSLCGTKLISKKNYAKLERWRSDSNLTDPFGDFELLFFASEFRIGSVDIPIKYRRRVYGTSQIRRFKHGLQLLRVLIGGFF